MNRQTWTDGRWVDVTPLQDGSVAVAMLVGRSVTVEARSLGGFSLAMWTRAIDIPAADFLYLRASADGIGNVCVIGQGQDGQAWICREGAALESLGETFGVFCVEVVGLDEGGWQIAILRQGYYELFFVPIAGPAVLTGATPTPTTQGFIQIDEGVVLQDDARLSVPGLVLPERWGIYAAGQNADDGPDRVRITDGTQFAALIQDYAQPPHVVQTLDGAVWVCSWLRSGAWVGGYAARDIPWGNDTMEPPEPEPPKPPPPPKVTITSYSPATGMEPLKTRAVAAFESDSGPTDTFRWLYRALGNGAWMVDAENPATDPDHTYTFPAGDWQIALNAIGPGGSHQTGLERRVTVQPQVPQPEPEPEPDVIARVYFTTDNSLNALCAEQADGVLIANRPADPVPADDAWERFDVLDIGRDSDGRQLVALLAVSTGRYLCAEDGGGNLAVANRDAIGAWETFVLEDHGGDVAFRSCNGWYLCAEGGGGGAVGFTRQEAGGWECFTPSEPLFGQPEIGKVRRLQGRVIWTPQGPADDFGLFVPVFWHFGDAPIEWRKDAGYVRAQLDVANAAGQMGLRAWMGRLLPSYWDDYILNDEQFATFQEELKSRNLRLMWDGGDLARATSDERRIVQQMLLDVGDRDVLASVAVANEGNDNGDMSPQQLAEWLAPIAERWPDLPVWCTTGGAGHECTAHGATTDPNYSQHWDMDYWNPHPAKVVGKHGYRDGSIVDKSRHCFSFKYEGQPTSPWVVDDEPPGVSAFVSVMSKREQMTPEGCATIFLTAAIAKNWWVFFPGVEKRTEPLVNFSAHLSRLASQAAQLPQDLFGFDDLEHGGTSQSRRVWEVTDTGAEETARCDHALRGNDAYVCSCYDDEGRQNFRQRKGTETSRIDNPPWGFVSIGKQE